MYVTRRLRDAPSIAILVAFVALTLYPLAFMVITSLKDLAQYNEQFWLPVWPLHLENYTAAWTAIAPYMLNSVIVTGASAAGVVVLSCFAAYAFARFAFPGREIFYYLVIFLLMIPAVLLHLLGSADGRLHAVLDPAAAAVLRGYALFHRGTHLGSAEGVIMQAGLPRA